MSMNGLIENFDSASTTPVDERVLKYIIPYFSDRFGNPSSAYTVGRKSRSAVETARTQISQALNCQPSEVFFTSGGTESNNWILKCFPYSSKTVVISAIEHPSVMATAEALAAKGDIDLVKIGVSGNGVIDLTELEDVLKSKPVDIVSIQTVNNEVGSVQPVAEIYAMCQKYGAGFHTDATQALGKTTTSFNADYMTVSAHKMYAPKGVGALIIRTTAKPLSPLILGGHQQSGMRAGTLPVPSIAGFGKACEYLQEGILTLENFRSDIKRAREVLRMYGATINSDDKCLPSFLNFSVPCDSSLVIAMMENEYGIALSKGAACMEGKSSYVLKAMGRTDAECRNSIRMSLCKFNKRDKLVSFPHMIQKCVIEVQKDS